MPSPLAEAIFAFNGKNEAAQSAVDKYIREYTWRIATQTRAAVNIAVERAIREGIPPREAAKLIKQFIGLDTKRTGAALAFRDKLVADGRSFGMVNRMTERYSEKLLRSRARTIARTETMAAMNAGSVASYKQARDEGFLGQDSGKEWIITPDEQLCEICAPMEGEVVPIDDDFSNGFAHPPAHPNCRCATGPADAEEVAKSTIRRVPTRTVIPAAPPTSVRIPPDLGGHGWKPGPNNAADVATASSYQSAEHNYIAKKLRLGRFLNESPDLTAAEKVFVEKMDSIVARRTLSRDTTFHRIVENSFGNKHLKVGTIFEDASYMSTTSSRELAEDLAAEWGSHLASKEKAHILRIIVPRGTPVLDMNAILESGKKLGVENFFPEQSEFVLRRGLRFMVEKDKDGFILRVIPDASFKKRTVAALRQVASAAITTAVQANQVLGAGRLGTLIDIIK